MKASNILQEAIELLAKIRKEQIEHGEHGDQKLISDIDKFMHDSDDENIQE